MSELKINKSIVLPTLDGIKDEEAKRIMQGFAKAITDLNQSTYNDLTLLDERVSDLEGE